MTEGKKRKWGYALALTLIVLAGLALRAHNLGSNSFWIDEIYSTTLTRIRFTDMAGLIPPDKPFLDYVVQWPFLHIHDHEFTARTPACVFGTLAILAIAMAARWAGGREGGDPTAALSAAVIVAFAPFVIRYSQEARPYSLAFLCIAAAMGCLLRADATRAPLRSRTWYGAVIFSVLAAYTLFFGWIFIALTFVWLVARGIVAAIRGSREDARLYLWRAVSFAVATLLLNVPFFMRMATAVGSASQAPFDAASWGEALRYVNLLGAAYDQEHGLWFGPVPSAVLFLPFALWGLVRVWRGSRWGAGFLVLQWLGGAALAVAFFAWRDHWLHARYLYFAMPGYYALLGVGLAGAGEWLARRASAPALRWSPVAALAILCIAWVFASPIQRPAWREWSRFVLDQASGKKTIEVVGLDGNDCQAMRYYFARWRNGERVRHMADWNRIVRRAKRGRTIYIAGADRERAAPQPPENPQGVRIEEIKDYPSLHAWKVTPNR